MDQYLVIAIAASAVAFVTLVLTAFYRARELKERRRAERRAEISAQLNEFYGPLAAQLNLARALYRLLAAGKPEGFSALTHLMDPYREYETKKGPARVVLGDPDNKLLEEIIAIEKGIEALVLTKAGLVEDEALLFDGAVDLHHADVASERTGLLAVALSYFRLLRMAYQGHFIGHRERFEGFVYPRDFETHIQEKMAALQAELERG